MSVTPQEDLWGQVDECLRSPEFLHSIVSMYAEVDAELASLSTDCRACGDCCRFDTSGVRLYVTTGELAVLSRLTPPVPDAPSLGRCPYQVGDSCDARDHRPLGCRIFFCHGPPRYNMQQEYERRHEAIQRLHQTHCLPYAYVDLVDAFMQLHSLK